ncbi:MAG: DUF2238 domain-containing protein [Planctomycetota bacterium]|nr:DUF2238 domain-containing protein [Planctomycetota bacterium]
MNPSPGSFAAAVKRYAPLGLFVGPYLVAGLVLCLARGNFEFLGYVVQMVLIAGAVAWAHVHARFTMPVLWLLAAWGLLHLLGGLVPIPAERAHDPARPVLYGLWIIRDWFKYDNLVHGFGFFAATLAVAQALRPFLDAATRPRLALVVILASAGMGLGAMNEMIEFGATVFVPDTGVGDYRNNALDLWWNAVGAVPAAVLSVGLLAKKNGVDTRPRRT